MEQTGHVARWVDQLDDMAVETTDAMLRADGSVQAPTVRVLVDGLAPAFVGQLECRPFYRGSDAHTAVAVMGLFGSMLDASRLLISYEHSDMALAWQDPARRMPRPAWASSMPSARHSRCSPWPAL